MKTPLEIRPSITASRTAVRAHAFTGMLGCYVQFVLARRLTPLLYTDHTPLSAVDAVAPAWGSRQAAAKAGSGRAADGHVTHSLRTYSQSSRTLCPNELRIGADEHAPGLTPATELQSSTFELLTITPT